MNHTEPRATRRQFLQGSVGVIAVGLLAGSVPTAARAADAAGDEIGFFLVSDTHYLADVAAPTKLEPRSREATTRLIDLLNSLPGTAIPSEAGGGAVSSSPRGVIHGGDLIDSGDKSGGDHPDMQKTELEAFEKDFGLDGKDGRLKLPVYEIHGNHDAPQGKGVALDAIVRRNKTRPGLSAVSSNGLHYSWDWGGVQFLNLGIVVGGGGETQRKRRYDPLGSHAFMVQTLREKVGDSRKPVILTHHVDVARNSGPCDTAAPFDNKEWDACDVHAYYEAIKPYNVVGILYGHTHARNIFAWNGRPAAEHGDGKSVEAYNITQSSHFAGTKHGIFYLTVKSGALTVREYATTDNWKTAQWTPQTWTS
jgi:cytolysin (calcineurin-like family phosphatase)